ncbi:hypothetical protein VNI00_009766 [Paramarasmius palmivorus]|uniref:Uncharacterized protein n=1 Tax=Paramarasmius palmivorus TaxID=297713 RepID=A0AAW0CMW6_9AGAR
MEVSTDSSNPAYDSKFDFISSNFASSSTSAFDLPGFHCNNTISSQGAARNRYTYHSYPSPPPSASNSKRSVPLPTLTIGECIQEDHDEVAELADSRSYISSPFTPLSPPATVLKSSSPLPPGDDAETDSCPSEDDHQALLSPLSPEWESAMDELSVVTSDGILLSGHGGRVGVTGLDDQADSRHDQWSITTNKEVDQLWMPQSPESDEDYDMGYLHSPLSSPPSSPDSDTTSPEDPIAFLPFFPHPSSPSIHSKDVDIIDVPDSPSWRTLPDLEMDTEVCDAATLLTPPSPSSKPFSLPGAEFDTEMIDVPSDPTISPGRRQSLLLLGEPDDVPTPRSPSPDNFDLDPAAYASCSDPDVARLIQLRKKAQSLERSAREREEKMLMSGWMAARAEARKERKREKERVKEISAMLRLRLEGNGQGLAVADEDMTSPSPKKGKTKRVISSMAQLVARMMFRRRECSDRPMIHTPLPPSVEVKRFRPSSPLRHSWSISDDEEESEDDEMGLDGLKGFDDMSEPMMVDESKRTRW